MIGQEDAHNPSPGPSAEMIDFASASAADGWPVKDGQHLALMSSMIDNLQRLKADYIRRDGFRDKDLLLEANKRIQMLEADKNATAAKVSEMQTDLAEQEIANETV